MDLAEVIDRITSRLPGSHIEKLAKALDKESVPTASARGRLGGLIPTPGFSELADALCQGWEASSEITGAGLALSLRSAHRSAETERGAQRIEIVWTGPSTPEVPLRTTREALIDVIRAAQRELIIVSFAAYKVEVVLRELETAADRGVKISLILETGAKEGGTLTFAAAGAFNSVGDRVSFYVWPTEKRPELEKGRAALHAKAAIADDHTAFITSANLTGHAITENMELGVLIAGGRIPQHLGGHFRQLISDRILERAR